MSHSRTYTVARVTESATVPLLRHHVARLGDDAAAALRELAARAPSGMYRLWWDGERLESQRVEGSALREGMPVRFAVSPFVASGGRFAKPSPPSLYDTVRVPGVATLLTNSAGNELFESCRASLVAWDGASLVLPPDDVPAVRSVAEAEVVRSFAPRRATLAVQSDWPLLLLNAVAGTCAITAPGRAAFPPDVRARLDTALAEE